MNSLLPNNSTTNEMSLEAAMALAFALDVPIRDVWDPDRCPVDLLPYLAWAWSVDEWDDSWIEGRKRGAIKDSLMVHKRKGTLWAIRRVLNRLGFADADIIEGLCLWKLDGSVALDGSHSLGNPTDWAKYRIIIISRPMSTAEGASMRRALEAVAPARCQLIAIDFSAVPWRLDGRVKLDGSYKLGVIT